MKKKKPASPAKRAAATIRRGIVRGVSRLLWALSPRLALWIIRHTLFVPYAKPPTPDQERVLKSANSFTMPVLGGNIACWKWGAGPVVVLVHGWGVTGISMHRFIKPLVDGGYSVVAFDVPAHGASDGRHTNFFEFVEALKAVLKRTGAPHAVIGYSMGAGAAVSLVEMYGPQTRLVLIAPLCDIYESTNSFLTHLGIYPGLYDEMLREYEKQYGTRFEEINPMFNAGKAGGKSLIVHDVDDGIIPINHSEELVGMFKNARLFKTSGLRHSRVLEADEVLHETVSFITGKDDAVSGG